MIAGRAGARPIRADGVIGVLAVGDGVEAVLGHHLVADSGEQLVLAVKAAVRSVRPVRGQIALVGGDLDQRDADEPGHVVRGGAFVAGQAR